MASNNPDLLQVSTCGINHAHQTGNARAPLRQRHIEDVASTSTFEKPHLPRLDRRKKKLSEQTKHKWRMTWKKWKHYAIRSHCAHQSIHNLKNNVKVCSY